MTDRPGDAFHVYDTTLRDGAQREGIAYSVADKLAVARLLDELGVGFIEGGWPGAMPKDTEFFARAASELELEHAELVAFGSTRKAGVVVEDDAQVRALVDSAAPVVTIVAKSDVRHVTEALRTTYDENLAMVTDTVAFLVSAGRRVFVDCEHFFDGFAHDSDYGVTLLTAAAEAGASVGVLCDTNGGMLPLRLAAVVREVGDRAPIRLGIHCQDDTACAVANTLAAVEAGATHVQCTANGYGERTGNADLFAVVANLETKLGLRVLPDGGLREMVRVSHAIAEVANLTPDTHQAYVGVSAFAHKAGLHASALKVSAELYNHVDPSVVGNDMRVLVTEMAGRASIELKGRELGFDLEERPELVAEVTARVKDLEARGYTFEAADASFELLLHEVRDGRRPQFWDVESWRTIVESNQSATGPIEPAAAEATVKVRAGGRRVVAVGEGNGPVNALDQALRQAVGQLYPAIEQLELVDYKVRITDASHGTDAMTRVLVETSDGQTSWVTVGVGSNVVEASWEALTDGLTYGLLRSGQAPHANS